MALKSLILSKLDHQMSKSWKRIVAHKLQTTSRFDLILLKKVENIGLQTNSKLLSKTGWKTEYLIAQLRT